MAPKFSREDILEKTGGKCLYCGCDIRNGKWQADHVHPIIRHPEKGTCVYPELDVYENIYPACAPCNNFKSSFDLEGFRKKIEEQFTNVIKYNTGARQLQRLGLLYLKSDTPVKFWFEENGITIPTKLEILGISPLIWKINTTEPDSYYTETDIGICTLRHVGSTGWIAIHLKPDWYKDKQTFYGCSLEQAKIKTTIWLKETKEKEENI